MEGVPHSGSPLIRSKMPSTTNWYVFRSERVTRHSENVVPIRTIDLCTGRRRSGHNGQCLQGGDLERTFPYIKKPAPPSKT